MNQSNRATGGAQDGAQRAPQVGTLLKASRLRVGEELRDIAEILCIRYLYLEAIEECRYGDLPGATYAVGFIRSYADHLGLDGEEVVRRYRAEQASDKRSNELFFPTPVTESGVPRGAVVFIGVLLAMIAYGGWYASTTDDGFLQNLISPVPERLSGKPAATSPPATAPTQPDQLAAAMSDKPAETASVSGPSKIKEKPAVEAASTTPVVNVEPSAAKPAAQPAPAQVPAITSTPASPPPAVSITAVEPATAQAVSERNDAAQEEATPAPTRTGFGGVEPAASRKTISEPKPAQPVTVPQPTARAAIDTQPVAGITGSAVVIKANGASYIEIVDAADNRTVHAELLAAGASYTVPTGSGLVLNTGNAGALDILVGGVRVPAIGGDGDVRRGILLDPKRLKAGTAVP